MGLETGTYVSDLVSSNPVGASDTKSQGDDHLRLLKAVLKSTFPTADRAFYFPVAEAIAADETVVAADQNNHYFVDATGAIRTVTLPTLAVGDAGWAVLVQKSDAGSNAVTVAPASGTINGAANISVTVQFGWILALWSGTTWFALAVNVYTVTDFGRELLAYASEAAFKTALGIDPATTSAAGVVEFATDAELFTSTSDKGLEAGHLESAAAAVALSDGATVAVDWDTGINFSLTVSGNRVLGNPTNGQPGTWRTVRVQGNNTTDRTLTFGTNYGGAPPVLADIDDTKHYLLMLYCVTASHFLVSYIDASAP